MHEKNRSGFDPRIGSTQRTIYLVAAVVAGAVGWLVRPASGGGALAIGIIACILLIVGLSGRCVATAIVRKLLYR